MIRVQSLLQLINQCPPFLIPVLARKQGALHKGMTLEEISAASGVSRRSLTRLVSKRTWDGIKIVTACRVLDACCIDVLRMSQYREYIKDTCHSRKPFRHLKDTRYRNLVFKRMKAFAETT